MRNGKLNKTEIKTLLRAMDILDKWAEYHEWHESNHHPNRIIEASNARAGINQVVCSVLCNDGD